MQELYLSPKEFQGAFGVELAAFEKQPKWKRDQAKKNAKIY